MFNWSRVSVAEGKAWSCEMNDRRQSNRQKSFLRGCVYFNNRRSAIDCLVRDISDVGAKLIFSEAVSIPDLVDLYIPQKEQMLRARVQWRHGGELGVGFGKGLSAETSAGTAAHRELIERVDRLEAEIAALRKMLKRLKAELADGDADQAA
jgi:hypothetical protein